MHDSVKYYGKHRTLCSGRIALYRTYAVAYKIGSRLDRSVTEGYSGEVETEEEIE